MAHSSPRPPSAPLFFGLSPALAGGPSSPRFPDLGGLAGGLPGLGARGGRRGVDAAGLVTGPGRSPGALPARPIGVRPGPAAPARDPRPEEPRAGGHPVERLEPQGPEHDPRRAPQRRDVRGDRRPAPPTGRQTGPSPLRGRLAVAAVAAGALATAGHSLAGLGALDDTSSTTAELALASERATDRDTSAAPGSRSTGLDAATSGVLPVIAPATSAAAASSTEASSDEGPGQVSSIAKAAERSAAQARAAAEAARPDFVKPAEGRFTSGFGARWGSSHRGVDIAGPIGTPIVSVGDGTVIESGPASGFGMWVKVQLEDGTINVYGHVNRSYVEEGQRVRAGEEIAEIGNRGRSTGPHLHFEVWTEGGNKINPLPWLAERGISLGGQQD
ncbi:peptidoglycan DD-metalloendopeptidase family protein [Actinomycetospora sp. CA-101289]|uniref:M23 family metallopeptidase n=1 Tax=Actinomycetospora sp. CA-101289 TaxID=3239893 RepID=UPI003D9669B1